MDGPRAGRCLDGDSLDIQPGGPVHVFPCTNRWNQFISFGNGKDTPANSLHTNVPLHTVRRISETGREQEPYMCIGVAGRGELDEDDWLGVREADTEEDEGQDDEIDRDNFTLEDDDEPEFDEDGEDLLPLSDWEGEQLVSTRCSNAGAIIEWILVPFIVEQEEVTGPMDLNSNDTEGEL